MKTIQLKLQCGETTCASESGKWCQFVGTRNFGTVHLCRLFPSVDNGATVLEDKDGWLQRCSSCLESTI